MRRILSLLLVSALLLSLLSACQQPPVTESDSLPSAAVDEPSAQELADAVFPFSGCDKALETEVLDADAVSIYLENAYGLEKDVCTDAAIIRGAGMSAFEITVLRLSGEDAATNAADRLEDYLHTREADFTGYAPAEADMVSNGRIRQEGAWLGLFICPDPEGAETAFQQALNGTVMIPSAPPDSVTNTVSTPEPEVNLNPENTPTFKEANLKEREGERDPNHPDRLKYTQPNEEDMSIYDTSAILAAWAASDPSSLSDYDREIYDAAKAVLDGSLTDGMSDYDKEVAIYAWIVQNVDYDRTFVDVLEETNRDTYGPYGGLVNRSAVCQGYSTTFQLLTDLAGLECITVVGASASSQMDHAWNMVQLDGNWYCVDVTWDASARELDEYYSSGWIWRFFNVTSDYMAKSDHQWDYDNVPEAVTEDHGQG